MKGRRGPKGPIPLLVLAVLLAYPASHVSGQTGSRSESESRSDIPVAGDSAPAAVQNTLTIIQSGNGKGKVLTNPPGPYFKRGASVTLSAVPAPYSVFTGWSGSCSGSARTCTVFLSTDRTVTAFFSLKTYSIHVRPPVNGVIHPYGTVKAIHGDKRKFQIIPLPGYRVSEVLVDKVPQGPVNSYTFMQVMADHILEVIFVKQ